eukprot:GHRR01025800.1.p1 GENE.GHRR01025800.1~~GHRR01025800.1.p1  ORF type:complete len:115 (-),score=40.70 GHRR01025800.1:1185-1529(-)
MKPSAAVDQAQPCRCRSWSSSSNRMALAATAPMAVQILAVAGAAYRRWEQQQLLATVTHMHIIDSLMMLASCVEKGDTSSDPIVIVPSSMVWICLVNVGIGAPGVGQNHVPIAC